MTALPITHRGADGFTTSYAVSSRDSLGRGVFVATCDVPPNLEKKVLIVR